MPSNSLLFLFRPEPRLGNIVSANVHCKQPFQKNPSYDEDFKISLTIISYFSGGLMPCLTRSRSTLRRLTFTTPQPQHNKRFTGLTSYVDPHATFLWVKEPSKQPNTAQMWGWNQSSIIQDSFRERYTASPNITQGSVQVDHADWHDPLTLSGHHI